jgi:hypothetical protein
VARLDVVDVVAAGEHFLRPVERVRADVDRILNDAAGAAGEVAADDVAGVFDDVGGFLDGVGRDVPRRVDCIFGIEAISSLLLFAGRSLRL